MLSVVLRRYDATIDPRRKSTKPASECGPTRSYQEPSDLRVRFGPGGLRATRRKRQSVEVTCRRLILVKLVSGKLISTKSHFENAALRLMWLPIIVHNELPKNRPGRGAKEITVRYRADHARRATKVDKRHRGRSRKVDSESEISLPIERRKLFRMRSDIGDQQVPLLTAARLRLQAP